MAQRQKSGARSGPGPGPGPGPGSPLGAARGPATRRRKAAERASPPAAVDGLPADLSRMLQPQARAQWLAASARYYTPEIIEMVLRVGLAGDLSGQWQLFHLMEDTWPRLNKNLLELKRSVVALDRTVIPARPAAGGDDAPPTAAAQARAALVARALAGFRPAPGAEENGLPETLFDLLDAWGKGVAAVEIDWTARCDHGVGSWIAPRATRWVSPWCYGYDPEAGALGLRVSQPGLPPAAGLDRRAGAPFVPFPPDKFLVAVRKARSGLLSAGALLRPLAWWWSAANFTSGWLLNFAQIFGQPLRWVTYDPGNPDLLPQLRTMLQQMGSAPWAVVPAGASLEFREPITAASDNPQAYVHELADRVCDILVLGQTLTTDVRDSGSRALGAVHQGVRDDIIAGAARWLDGLLSEQFAPAVLRVNYGDDADCPRIVSAARREPDPLTMARRDAALLGQGVPLPRRWFYQRHNIPAPEPGDELLAPPARNAATPPSPAP